MNNRKQAIQRDILLLTLSMFVMIAMWIGFNLYNSHVTSTIDTTLQTQILPIPGTFDTAALEKIKQRTSIKPNYDSPISTISASEPSPTVTISPTVTPTTAATDLEDLTANLTPTNSTAGGIPSLPATTPSPVQEETQ